MWGKYCEIAGLSMQITFATLWLTAGTCKLSIPQGNIGAWLVVNKWTCPRWKTIYCVAKLNTAGCSNYIEVLVDNNTMVFPVSVLPADERKDNFALKNSLVTNCACPLFIVSLREHRSVPSFAVTKNWKTNRQLSLESKLFTLS